MLIKWIRLRNIRSYLSEEIHFPEGSTLLSGDIGAGKSTILLAIEFALFGFSTDVSGETLLRNGKPSGSVELCFDVDSKNVIIKYTCFSLETCQRIGQISYWFGHCLPTSTGLLLYRKAASPAADIASSYQCSPIA